MEEEEADPSGKYRKLLPSAQNVFSDKDWVPGYVHRVLHNMLEPEQDGLACETEERDGGT